MIQQSIRHYDFSGLPWASEATGCPLDPVFAIEFTARPCELSGLLVEAAGLFGITVSDKSRLSIEQRLSQASSDYGSEIRLHDYMTCASEDGSCPVMEMWLLSAEDFRPWTVGFPLALCGDQSTEHHFAMFYDGVWFSILCDGVVMDRESPEAPPQHYYEGTPHHDVFSKAVHGYRVSTSLEGLKSTDLPSVCTSAMQYYTPYGFNTWLGDVATYSWKGRYHIFYLLDRHHHMTRRGKGIHCFAHISTADFKEWIDHGPIFDLDQRWQSMGTGNAFEYDGKLCLAFGWHTERSRPYYRRSTFLTKLHLQNYGDTGEFRNGQLGDLTPAGATYAISEDGVHFKPSNVIMHYLTNPSLFNQPDGTLHLIQDGIWSSDHPGSWRLIEKNFPPRGKDAFSHNSLECPNFFKLNGWEYMMVGFVGFYGREDRRGAQWIDFTEKGWEPYDGSCVPMAAVHNGRVIEGGWIDGLGWGSCLLLREIIPLDGNGRVGKRFLEEALPTFGRTAEFRGMASLKSSVNQMLLVEVPPETQGLTVTFDDANGHACQLRWNGIRHRAQWCEASAGEIPTVREQSLAHPEYTGFRHFQYLPRNGRDYAREALDFLEGGFRLRIMIHADPKLGTVILDAEFGRKHTMLTHRKDMKHIDNVSAVDAAGAPVDMTLLLP